MSNSLIQSQIEIYGYDTHIKVIDYSNNQRTVLMDVINKSIEAMPGVKIPEPTPNDRKTDVEHIFSKDLDKSASHCDTTEHMEFHVDDNEHNLMKSGVFLKIVLKKI